MNSGRPISWHVDSREVNHWPEVSKPCSASWDYSIQREMASEVVPMPRTVSLEKVVQSGAHAPPYYGAVEVQRPVSVNYSNHVHYPVVSGRPPRTVSLENGISDVRQPRTVSMDYSGHPFLLANDAMRPRTISMENGLHQGVGHHNQRTASSMDYNAHYHLANEARTVSLENGIHQGNQRTSSVDHNVHPHYPLANQALRPRTVSLENGIYQCEVLNQRMRPCLVGMGLPVSSLPPTILTSFVKTPAKQVKGFRDHSSPDNYRCDKSQMIPTKLLAGSLSSITNGRLYQKGLSS